jgi:hypothetical protein
MRKNVVLSIIVINIIILLSGCTQMTGVQYATMEDLKALRLEMHLNAYLNRQTNVPAEISDIYWIKDTQTVKIKVMTAQDALQNWPISISKLMNEKPPDIKRVKNQKNVNNQAKVLGTFFVIIANQVFDPEKKGYKIDIEFYDISDRTNNTPFQIILKKTWQ